MTVKYAVFDPCLESFEWFSSRENAEAAARRWLKESAQAAETDGWPELMNALAVYECRPLLVVREVDRKQAVECPEDREDHDDCETCEGACLVDDVDGEAWHHGDDFAYTCNYELVAAEGGQ